MVSDPPSDKSTFAQYQAKQQRKGEEYTRSDWSDPENITVYAGPSDVVQAMLQSRRSLSIEVTCITWDKRRSSHHRVGARVKRPQARNCSSLFIHCFSLFIASHSAVLPRASLVCLSFSFLFSRVRPVSTPLPGTHVHVELLSTFHESRRRFCHHRSFALSLCFTVSSPFPWVTL